MSITIKKEDAVKVIAGVDKGKTGEVIAVIKGEKGDKVVVKGAGLSTDKHFVKPRNAQQRGGIIEKERAIDISNVMVICPSCGKTTRIGVSVSEDENGKKTKTRVCKKCGESLDKRKSVRATKKKASKTAAKKTAAKKTAQDESEK
ncbi:MAG TPA: 50S ribosomal protein L24 [Candidatus Caccalectryoclostridium excrementigallinarum]|uniref:Large ribosomal subunit protein uL24 n=1 Tax=Candidatus Caccalectryoclostridium excrementigallinarum TaxID=2840710 RepID=A0A9D1MMT1_9FIRM|nr:50S ribosomal protein L24 [Candidatus Caccalectryoclostridium excrementigallinarum]